MAKINRTRRNFLQAAGLGLIGLSLPNPLRALAGSIQPEKELLLYVGTYTKGKSEGIYLYRLHPETGKFTLVNTVKGGENPSYLTLDPQRRFLYAVNEVTEFDGEKSGAVSAFAVDQKTGELTLLNQQPSLGGAPCYVAVDKTGKNVLVANYVGGNVAVLPVQENGYLLPASDSAQHQGSGGNPNRQKGPHAHCIVLDPNNRYAFAADLGIDQLKGYRFDARQGKLTPNQPSSVATKPGAGPRHFTFHPNGRSAYLINELNSTVTAFAYDQRSGSLQEIHTVSTLPEDFTGDSFCADIHVSPNGRFVYGSNRGHDSIAVFAVDMRSGKLTPVQHVSTQGKWPRNFTLDPSGRLLLVANQNTDNIVSFRVDSRTGKLTPTGQSIEVPSPVCLQVVPAMG
jgi:6-phosphogluconolactonase